MRPAFYPISFLLLLALLIPAIARDVQAQGTIDVAIDGMPTTSTIGDLPANPPGDPSGLTNIDIVGGTSHVGSNPGRAKGNSYRIDSAVFLFEAEFWINFSGTETLTYYVFDSPVEFGTYSEVYRNSELVTGSGAGWYSTGPIMVTMYTGWHYIIAVSWDGNMTYYYDTGDEQPTSFGAHTHGYAVGYDPLPSSFESTSNDQAIYHQRLTTDYATPVEVSTWGRLKTLYR